MFHKSEFAKRKKTKMEAKLQNVQIICRFMNKKTKKVVDLFTFLLYDRKTVAHL